MTRLRSWLADFLRHPHRDDWHDYSYGSRKPERSP